MSRTKLGVIGATVLGGVLVLVVAATALAQGPTPSSSAQASGAAGYGTTGMMGGLHAGTSAAPSTTKPAATTFPSMMGTNWHMDADDAQQMLTWMQQAGPQYKAMYDAMVQQGCSYTTMRQFLASPSPAS